MAELPSSSNQDWSYETASQQVEAIIDQLEREILPLDQVFDQFEIAVNQLHQCDKFLQQQQSQLELLVEVLEDHENE